LAWLNDPFVRAVLLVGWLLPCAIQDRRTRHASNWLTVPLFVLAWPAAHLTGNLPLTLAVFAGVFLAWRWDGGLGPADGKIAVGLAGIAPPALVAGVIIQGLAFLYARVRDRRPVRLPGAVGFYLGAVIATLILASFRFV
jgi:Flp pilus assembly protein protease CpaA